MLPPVFTLRAVTTQRGRLIIASIWKQLSLAYLNLLLYFSSAKSGHADELSFALLIFICKSFVSAHMTTRSVELNATGFSQRYVKAIGSSIPKVSYFHWGSWAVRLSLVGKSDIFILGIPRDYFLLAIYKLNLSKVYLALRLPNCSCQHACTESSSW